MKNLSSYLLCLFCFNCSCEYKSSSECDRVFALPLTIRDTIDVNQFYQAKLILYKVNIALGSNVQPGMPGSEPLAKKTKSLAEIDLQFNAHYYDREKSIFIFEFDGGLYPSDHPYYNTIDFNLSNGAVEVSESGRFKMLVDPGTYDKDFNSHLDTIGYDLSQFLKCYSAQR